MRAVLGAKKRNESEGVEGGLCCAGTYADISSLAGDEKKHLSVLGLTGYTWTHSDGANFSPSLGVLEGKLRGVKCRLLDD